MVKASVPPNFFICPISRELMKDPVTLSTGQTYDRRSIEKWFGAGHNTCPSTMQVLKTMDVAPNVQLQRLIHQWCASNNYGHGLAALEVVTTTASSTNRAERRQVMKMMREISARGADSYNNLKILRSLATDLDHDYYNRTVLVAAGAVPVLANFIFSPASLGKDLDACEEALGVLTLLPLQEMRKLVQIGTKQLTAISWLLNRGSLDGRVNAALLLAALAADDMEMKASVGATAGVFEGLLLLLKERLYAGAIDAGWRTVLAIISGGPERNTVRAVKAGLVVAVAELLLEAEGKNTSQVRGLTRLLELLCSCAEGVEAAGAHTLVVPVLVKIINLNDRIASERALSCLWILCQSSPKRSVQAARQAGILTQLLRLVQSEDHRIKPETKQKATYLLRQLRHKL